MSKKINELTPLTDPQVDDNSLLTPLGNAANGLLKRATIAQLKAIFSTQKLKYVADGTEGSTLTISALEGKEILSISREGSAMYEVESGPDTTEFIWDDTDITLGLAVAGAGERFLILYKNA